MGNSVSGDNNTSSSGSAAKVSVAAGGCPVEHKQPPNTTSPNTSETSCPIHLSQSDGTFNADINDFNSPNQLLESTAQQSQLSKKRVVSSIPRGNFKPAHQPENPTDTQDSSRWVYPSEQQYYNAMRRKGYSPQERDMSVVLLIHNLVNEQGWAQIKEWESYRGNDQPKLLRFSGRPQDVSPKAWITSTLFGYRRPFDRHDWVVQRSEGEEVRYVIDFYKGHTGATMRNSSSPSSPVAIYLDVRPAVDSLTAAVDRVTFNLRRRFLPHTLPPTCLTSSPFFRALQQRTELTASSTTAANTATVETMVPSAVSTKNDSSG